MKKINNFDNDILKSDRITLVDFYADWCAPCRMLAPILEQLSNKNSDFDIAKISVDDNQDIAGKYSVFSIPTLIVFKNGNEVERLVGYKSLEELESVMKKHI